MKETEDRHTQVIFPSNHPNSHLEKKKGTSFHILKNLYPVSLQIYFVYILLYFMLNFVS